MLQDKSRLHALAVHPFGETDGEGQFWVEAERGDSRQGDTCFLRHKTDERAYHFHIAVEPSVAAKKGLGGKEETVSLRESISKDIETDRNFGGNPTEPVITDDYAAYAFGNIKLVSSAPAGVIR